MVHFSPAYRPLPDERRARLRLVDSTPATSRRQDCSTCRNIHSCWQSGIDERHIVLSLLVCRIKRGIDINRSTKLFLEMIRPKLKRMAHGIAKVEGRRADRAMIMADLESQSVEQIMHHYSVGEVAYPLHYLFGFPNGVIRRYAAAYRERIVKGRVLVPVEDIETAGRGGPSVSSHTGMQSVSRTPHALRPDMRIDPTADEAIDEQRVAQRMDAVRALIDDGITLRASEYRVLKFCLANARDGGVKRPLNGLHMHLSKSMGVIRARVTKLYSDASTRLVEVAKEHCI